MIWKRLCSKTTELPEYSTRVFILWQAKFMLIQFVWRCFHQFYGNNPIFGLMWIHFFVLKIKKKNGQHQSTAKVTIIMKLRFCGKKLYKSFKLNKSFIFIAQVITFFTFSRKFYLMWFFSYCRTISTSSCVKLCELHF